MGELVPAACVGNETSKVDTIGAGGCYVYCIWKKLQRSSTGRVCGWRLYNGVLNDANGALSLLNGIRPGVTSGLDSFQAVYCS